MRAVMHALTHEHAHCAGAPVPVRAHHRCRPCSPSQALQAAAEWIRHPRHCHGGWVRHMRVAAYHHAHARSWWHGVAAAYGHHCICATDGDGEPCKHLQICRSCTAATPAASTDLLIPEIDWTLRSTTNRLNRISLLFLHPWLQVCPMSP